jgi:hypothetical protein
MTTYYPLVKSNTKAPSFMPAFDGSNYTVTIQHNISSQRYYVNCKDYNGVLIFMRPLIETPNPVAIESLEWDLENEVVIGTLAAPLYSFLPGEIVNISIIQAVPNTYNGDGMATIIDEMTFTYPMKNNPGPMHQAGVAQFLISLTKGYFNSTLVFRNMQFEVTP